MFLSLKNTLYPKFDEKLIFWVKSDFKRSLGTNFEKKSCYGISIFLTLRLKVDEFSSRILYKH